MRTGIGFMTLKLPYVVMVLAATLTNSLWTSSTFAQEAERQLSTELELGAIFTAGNTEDENIKFKGTITWLQNSWEYGLSVDGFRSSKENVLAAQRLYTVGSTTYNMSESTFILTRAAHEDDRFSGYDSQSDLSVSYGQNLLRNRENMDWNYTVGAGIRSSRSEVDDFEEAILRLGTEYRWNVSANARFIQTFSIEAGDESSITRAESSIQSDLLDNMSMKFSVKVKHQSEVPLGREKTDSEASVTLLLRL
jgi:putative salt-induced outer membrane protein